MAYITRYVVTIITAADGSGTGYTAVANGLVQMIRYLKTDYAAGVDFVVSAEGSGETILSLTNADASIGMYPTAHHSSTVGVDRLYAAGGTAVPCQIPVSEERIKIVVAQGGDAKTGTFHVYVEGG